MTGRNQRVGLLDAMSADCQLANCAKLAAHAMAEIGSDQDDAESLVRLLEMLRDRLHQRYQDVAGEPYSTPSAPAG
jgi:hypothetical protein